MAADAVLIIAFGCAFAGLMAIAVHLIRCENCALQEENRMFQDMFRRLEQQCASITLELSRATASSRCGPDNPLLRR